MNLKPLLGRSLKDPEVVDILELFEMDVIYAFDRDFENQPDRYYASAPSGGFELQFDAKQKLATIFVYVNETDQFKAFDLAQSDLESFGSREEVTRYCEERGLRCAENRTHPSVYQWIRIDNKDHSLHYLFGSSGLTRITLMRSDVVPGASQQCAERVT